MILANWLFQDEVLFLALIGNLANIISRKDDHYIVLGWCTLARNLVEYETSMIKLPTNGNCQCFSIDFTITCMFMNVYLLNPVICLPLGNLLHIYHNMPCRIKVLVFPWSLPSGLGVNCQMVVEY